GPDAEVVDRIDYSVDDSRRASFVAAIRRYLPDLDGADLQPAYAGIRTSAADGDFHLLGPAEQGVEGLVSLLGIDSPGLTACLTLADKVVQRFALGS
ncbi:MAG: FAD-dependent oxidoreductase, partial [Xanthomonadales bacterium]|nr:FAD-dependent oxidoreductase [Xanthomonadales bacterium]